MNQRRNQRKRVDILVSGRGSNMAALITAALDPNYPAQINRVISNNPDAAALKYAAEHDVPVVTIDHRDYEDRAAHEAAIAKVLDADRADFICLAGYLRILSGDIVRRYSGRMLNIHPSLLPAFQGIDTHERAIEAGVRIHGASVHFVTEGVDEGPIIAQAAVAVLPDDTADKLAARVLECEHRLYPYALRLAAQGQVRMSGGKAVFARIDGTKIASVPLFSPDPEA